MRERLVKIYPMEERAQEIVLSQFTYAQLSEIEALVEGILEIKKKIWEIRYKLWHARGEDYDTGKRILRKLWKFLTPSRTRAKIDTLIAEQNKYEALYQEKGYPDVEKIEQTLKRGGFLFGKKKEFEKEMTTSYCTNMKLLSLKRRIDETKTLRKIIEEL